MYFCCSMLEVATSWCSVIWLKSIGLSAIFSDVSCQRALSSGGHRFLSLWRCSCFFDQMLCHPVCSTNVLGYFHQLGREGINQSVFPWLWRLGGQNILCVKHWNGICYFQMYSIFRSNLQSRQLGGCRVLNTAKRANMKLNYNAWSQKFHEDLGICLARTDLIGALLTVKTLIGSLIDSPKDVSTAESFAKYSLAYIVNNI